MKDTFGREINYMRVSLTKQCNFRCQYCMPNTPDDFFDDRALELPKMLEFLKIALDNGIQKIRFTGGEPLLRPDIADFIAGLYAHKSDLEIAMTTNASLLEKHALALKNAGLQRINISLDSLKPERIKILSKRDALGAVLAGIDKALEVGLRVKLNMVALEFNADEILDILEFAKNKAVMVRYIEFMENTHAIGGLKGLSAKQILEIIGKKYKVGAVFKENFGPAKIWQILGENLDSESVLDSKGVLDSENSLDSESGQALSVDSEIGVDSEISESKRAKNYCFGIIAPHEDDFCSSCNRIRLTSDGILCPCLFYQDAVDAREAILKGDKAEMQRLFRLAIHNKPEKNQWCEDVENSLESSSSDSNSQDSQKDPRISNRAFYHTGG